jgi:lipase chaperone LimK
MKLRSTSVMVLGLLTVSAAGWLWMHARAAVAPALVAPHEAPIPKALLATPPDLLAPAAPAERAQLRTPAQFSQWLHAQSSLRGTQLDGAWDVDGHGALHPTVALRRRFDQLLTLAGEAKVDEITAFIEQQVTEEHGAAAARAVLDAWQRYVALQRHVFTERIDPADRSSLQRALAERQRVRRDVLGFDLATAFFADEEARAEAQLMAPPGSPPPTDVHTAVIDRATLDPAALARLQQADAAWADWQRRLADAKQRIQTLQSAPELSDVQKREAVDRLIAQQFDTHEAVRVRALLHLPAPQQ